MAKTLGENEIRVNKTCVSISKDLYEKANGTLYAIVSYSKYSGDINIRFSPEKRPGAIIVNAVDSDNQVSLDNTCLRQNREGTYEGIVDDTAGSNSIRAKKIK